LGEAAAMEVAGEQISSLVDTILFLRYVESGGETNRVISIVKSRGAHHSNQLREFRITSHGIEIADVYAGEGGVLTGTARQEKEARDAVELRKAGAQIEAKRREIAHRKALVRAEQARLAAAVEQAEIELENLEIERDKAAQEQQERRVLRDSSQNPGTPSEGTC